MSEAAETPPSGTQAKPRPAPLSRLGKRLVALGVSALQLYFSSPLNTNFGISHL